jgi:putative flippase GtrA
MFTLVQRRSPSKPDYKVISSASSPLSQGRAVVPVRSSGPFAQYKEVFLFLAVGGTSAMIYMVLGVFFTSVVGMRPSIAIIATLLLLIPPSYLAQRSLTFRSNRRHASAFPRYVGTQALGNALALVCSEIFPALIRDQPRIAFLIVAVGVATTNFFLLKLWTFRSAK